MRPGPSLRGLAFYNRARKRGERPNGPLPLWKGTKKSDERQSFLVGHQDEVLVVLEDGSGDLRSDRAKEGVLDGLGLVGAGGHHQNPLSLHDVTHAHGVSVGGNLVDGGEEALVGVAGALGEGHLVGAQGEVVVGLVEADVAVDAQTQQLQVDAAEVGDQLVVALALAVAVDTAGYVGVGKVDVHVVKQVVAHKIGVALVVVGGQTGILVQVNRAHGGEVQVTGLVPLNELLIGADGGGAGSQAQNTVGLELDLSGDDVGGGAAHGVVIFSLDDSHCRFLQLNNFVAVNVDGVQFQILGEQQQVGLLAHGDGADLVIQPHRLGGGGGESGDGVLQRQAKGDYVLQLLQQVGGGAGQGVGAQQGGPAVLHLDGLAAQLILAVGHARAAQRVADDDQLLAEHAVSGADDGGVDVQAVADELHGGAAVQGGGNDAGFPVEQRGHAVIQVGGVRGAGGVGGHGGLVVGSGVADGDGAHLGDLLNEGDSALLLRGHGDQADLAAAGGVEAVEHLRVGLMQVLRSLSAALGVGQEGALQVDARTLGAIGGTDKATDGLHSGGEDLLLQGHGGGQEGGDAVGGVVLGHGGQALGLAVGEVFVHSAVGVHVDKAGHQVLALGVHVTGPSGRADGGDHTVLHGHGALLELAVYKYVCVSDDHDYTSGREAAAALWPTRRVFSSGREGNSLPSHSGYSSASTRLASSRMRSPPLPDMTRPSSSTCLQW